MFRVLVVDDDPDINMAVREGLRMAGYDTVPALTGEAALAEVERHVPDLVLLDQMLPDIDGVEICRRLRAAAPTKEIPIMFLTARSAPDARVRGLAVGADDYVIKPFGMQELVLRIRAVLRRASPVEAKLPADWVRQRDQFRVWNRYAEIHHTRGEWRESMELSRSILRNCPAALGPEERRIVEERIAQSRQSLGEHSSSRPADSEVRPR